MGSRRPQSIWLGYDRRESTAFAVARYSLERFDNYRKVRGVVLSDLQARGLYTRPTRVGVNSEGKRQLYDELSVRADYDGAISTEHANARFLVPFLAKTGWAAFTDCDVMWMVSASELFSYADDSKALMCVHHDYRPQEKTKMDGQPQSDYPRKNQSSVMLINCDHPANRALTIDMVNTLPGRDLHRYCWLDESEIGELPPEFNYLVGVSKLPEGVTPKIVHFTRGLPDMAGWENQEYANEWRALVPYAVGAL